MRFILWSFVALCPFFLFAEEKNDYTRSEEETPQIESQHQDSNTKKLLKDLGNYESYRPDSSMMQLAILFKKNVINLI